MDGAGWLGSHRRKHLSGGACILATLPQHLAHAGGGLAGGSGQGQPWTRSIGWQCREVLHEVAGHLRGLAGARAAQQDLDPLPSCPLADDACDFGLLVIRTAEVEPGSIEEERPAAAGRADEPIGGRESGGPCRDAGRPHSRSCSTNIETGCPLANAAKVDAGVPIADRPHRQAHAEHGQELRLGGGVATGHVDKQHDCRDVVRADHAAAAVGIEIMSVDCEGGRAHRPAPCRDAPASRSLSCCQRPRGGFQKKTPLRRPASSAGVSRPCMPRMKA